MDKQLFYTNRLKAAWMNETFNAKLRGSRGEKLYWDGGDFRVERACGVFGGTHFYVDKISLPLFQPKVGDLVLTGDNDYMVITYDSKMFEARHGIKEIIRRNNKAFFWPEVENG